MTHNLAKALAAGLTLLGTACGSVGKVQAANITELLCTDEGFINGTYECKSVQSVGSDLEILINETAQKVKIAIIRRRGDWWAPDAKELFFDKCDVITASDWKCAWENTGGGLTISTAYGMSRGRYYHHSTVSGRSGATKYYISSKH